MAVYTELTFEEAQAIIENYNLGTLLEISPLSLGISNSNYQIEVKKKDETKKFLLKVSNDKGPQQLKSEQDILISLQDLGFPYSICSLITKEKEHIYHLDDKFGVIFPFVDGIPPGPSDLTCAEIGKGLATLHSLDLTKLHSSIRSQDDVGYGATQILDFLNTKECPKDFNNFFKRIFPDNLEGYLKASFAEGLIHGDLYYDNTLFYNNHLKAILDFEQAGLGPLIFDIGISISGTCIEKGCIIRPLIKSFLKGYESVRTLPLEEGEFLNQSILLGLFSISLWRIKRFTLGNLDANRANSYTELLQRAINFKNSMAELKRSPF